MKWLMACLLAVALAAQAETVTVQNVVATPHFPWDGWIDIDYEVVAENPEAALWVYPQSLDGTAPSPCTP